MKKDLEQQIYFEDMEIGDKVVSVGRTITEADIVSFAGLTGDYNTLHTDAEFAKGSIAGQRLAHGMLPLTYSSGLFTRTSYNQAMMAQMAALTEINWKFKKPVLIGDTIHVEQEVIDGLYNYRDPATGRRVISLALRNKDAVLLGLRGYECGDIVYWLEEGFTRVHGDSLSTQMGGAHTSVSPIFIAAGAAIKENYVTGRDIRQVDVAPTIAAVLGVRMPEQNEGSVVHQILSEEF